MLRFTLARNTPLNAEKRAQLARVAERPDDQIDFSDLPASPAEAEWTRPHAAMIDPTPPDHTLESDTAHKSEQPAWSEWFDGEGVSEDFMAERDQPDDQERESFD